MAIPISSKIYIGTLPPNPGAITARPSVALCTSAIIAFDTGKSIAVRDARYPPSSTIFAINACARRSSIVGS